MIFLDSSDIVAINKFLNEGIIRGVTTNPTILKKDGIKNIKKRLEQIAFAIKPYPVSIELTNNNIMAMYDEAVAWKEIGWNVVIKVPIHGPNGVSNLWLVKELESGGIRTNVTACMNAQQLYLAHLAGACYVSLFGGRVADMGCSVEEEIAKFKAIRDRSPINMTGTIDNARLILGSVREVSNVIDWLVAGADIVTVPPNILEKMIVHPRTKETVQQFLEDAK